MSARMIRHYTHITRGAARKAIEQLDAQPILPRTAALQIAMETSEPQRFSNWLSFVEVFVEALSRFLVSYGECGRIRTCDPCLKRALLYQLSYAPTSFS